MPSGATHVKLQSGSPLEQASLVVIPEVDELLAAIERQEPQALQQLYDLYGRQVYSLAYAMTQQRETAEEITQDVFLKVWHKIAQYEQGTHFRAWLLRITRTTTIDRIRHDRHNQQETWLWDAEHLNGNSNLPDEDTRWVWHALQQLPSDQRQALELAYLQGLTHQQIAERLNSPLGTVKTRIRDGVLKLRQVWEKEGLA